jgi:ABC-type multidrug transport system fused ATPase/permease subunit
VFLDSEIGGARTTIMATHALQAIHMADRVLVVYDGGVTESGTNGELMAWSGQFASLAQGGDV